MRDEDPDARRRVVAHEIGADLSSLSLHELDERVVLLEEEIRRLREEATRKASSRDAAAAFFKASGAG